MNVCCVISGVGSGGAERVMTTICNHLLEHGHHVVLVTLGRDEKSFYPLDSRTRRVELAVSGDSASVREAIAGNLNTIRALRRALRQSRPDVVLSFMSEMNVATLLAAAGLGVPVVVAERTYSPNYHIGRVRGLLRRLLYPGAAAVVVQSRAAAKWATESLRLARVVVLPNAIGGAFLTDDPSVGRVPLIASIGRLDRNKAHHILIEAFARLHARHPMWRLEIAGDGPELETLQAQADAAVPGRVQFAGLVRDPERLLARASIFVLTSRIEGFPNALLEAMACGCAVVSTDCDSGPSDMIRDESEGVLVPVDDVEQIADAIEGLINDPARRSSMGLRAKDVRRRYDAAVILAEWDRVLVRAARCSAK